MSCRINSTAFHLTHCSFGLHLLVAFFVGLFVLYWKKHWTASKHFWCLQPRLITSRLHSLEQDILFNCVTWGWPFGHPCILPLCYIPIVLLKGFQDTRAFSGFTFLSPVAFLTPASLELMVFYISENWGFISFILTQCLFLHSEAESCSMCIALFILNFNCLFSCPGTHCSDLPAPLVLSPGL